MLGAGARGTTVRSRPAAPPRLQHSLQGGNLGTKTIHAVADTDSTDGRTRGRAGPKAQGHAVEVTRQIGLRKDDLVVLANIAMQLNRGAMLSLQENAEQLSEQVDVSARCAVLAAVEKEIHRLHVVTNLNLPIDKALLAVEHHAVQMRQAFFTETRLRPFDAPIGVVANLAPELIGREPRAFALVHDLAVRISICGKDMSEDLVERNQVGNIDIDERSR